MVIGPKIEKNFFLHFSTFHDPLITKNLKKKKFFWRFIVRTYVCRALNHLISRDPQMLEP